MEARKKTGGVLGVSLSAMLALLLLTLSVSVPHAYAAPKVSYYSATGESSMQQANRLSIATGQETDPATIACGGSSAVKQAVSASGRNTTRNKAATAYRLSGYTSAMSNRTKADLTSKLISAIRASDYITTGTALLVEDAEPGDAFTVEYSYPLAGTHDGKPVSARLVITGIATGKNHVDDLQGTPTERVWGSPEITCPMVHMTDLLFAGGYVCNATNVSYDLSFAYASNGQRVPVDGSSLTVLSQNWYPSYNERIYLPESKTAEVGVLSDDQNGHMNVTNARNTSFGNAVVSTPLEDYEKVEGDRYDRIGSPQFETNATQFSQTGTSFSWGACSFDTKHTAPGTSVADSYGATGWFAFASSPLVPVIPDNPTKSVDRKHAEPGDTVTYTIKQRMGALGTETITTYKQFVFRDELPEGLEYNDDLQVTDSYGNDVTDQGSVSVQGNEVEFTFDDEFLQDTRNYNGRDVTFTLSGTVSDSADDGAELDNSATTEFNDYYVLTTDNVTIRVDNKVDVHFVDGLNSLKISDVRLPYGEMPEAPEAPTHQGYEFVGWDDEIVAATEEATYTALYDRIMVPVTFVDGLTDETIDEVEVEWGGDAQPPSIPEHEGYVPVGWDKPATNIRTATTITVNYAPARDVNYVVRYVEQDAGNDLAPAKVVTDGLFGSTVFERAIDIETYQVVGEPTQNLVLDAYGKELVFEYAKNMIPVHFVDGLDGSSIDEQTVHQGTPATEPKVPSHFGYDFTGWDKPFDDIEEETTVTAQFEPSGNFKYNVRYVDTEGKQLADDKHVENVTYQQTVTETAIEIDGYLLTGDASVTETIDADDKEIVFVYEMIRHTVTFQLPDGTPLKTETVEHHGGATAPGDPVIEGKSFTGWDRPYDDVVEDIVVTAQFKDSSGSSSDPSGSSSDPSGSSSDPSGSSSDPSGSSSDPSGSSAGSADASPGSSSPFGVTTEGKTRGASNGSGSDDPNSSNASSTKASPRASSGTGTNGTGTTTAYGSGNTGANTVGKSNLPKTGDTPIVPAVATILAFAAAAAFVAWRKSTQPEGMPSKPNKRR